MESRAKLSFARLSPRKTRLVVDMVRGKDIQIALNILKFTPQPSARLVAKLLSSAVANAEQKGVSDIDRLFVKSISVDGGPVLKRFLPRAAT
jgi:large subunit ribosomal protein L22